MNCRSCFLLIIVAFLWGCLSGCGSTKTTNTARTATEQLVISDAMDRAVSQVDFSSLAGRKVFFETKYLKATDSEYLISLIRQHALASGCRVEDDKKLAEYIVEVRGGATGTDQHDLLLGVPETSLPFTLPGINVSMVPEIAVAKDTTQKAIVKLGFFAYNATTGRPIWQSGNLIAQSNARNMWVFGVGPIQYGDIYSRSRIAGREMPLPIIGDAGRESISIGEQAFFAEPPEKQLAGDDPPTDAEAPGTDSAQVVAGPSPQTPSPSAPAIPAPTAPVPAIPAPQYGAGIAVPSGGAMN